MPARRIAYFAGTAGNWGGASRVLFTNLGMLDRTRYSPIVLLSGAGPARELLRDMTIPCEEWGPLTEPGNPLAYARAMLRTWRWLRRERVELVHMNRANDWRPAEILAIRLARIPLVTHFHTVNQDHAPATRWSSAIAAVSRYVAEQADNQGVPVRVIHNAVDLARFSGGRDLRPELGIAADAKVVAYVGQIREIKGLADFIAMAPHIPGADVHFLIAGNCRDPKVMGDAYTEDGLREMLKLDSRLRYCGYLGAIEDLYRSCDVVVAPSRWQEPFGLVCIEAGAAGKPLVATRVGGIPEIIDDGVNGYLAEPGDVSGLAARVAALLADSNLRNTLGQAARARVERDFTRRPVRELEDLYDSLLA